MPTLRLLAAATLAPVLLLGAGVGFAATTEVASSALGGGAALVGRCHTGPVLVRGTTPGPMIDNLDVADLAAECDGGLLRVAVFDGDGAMVATGAAVVTAARPVAVPLDAPVARGHVATAHLVVEGPW